MKPVQKVLDDADLQKNQVDEIVLVGGSTRILKIQQLVKDFFSGKVSLLKSNVHQVTKLLTNDFVDGVFHYFDPCNG